MGLERVDIFGINLGTDVASDVGVRDCHPIHQPADLVASLDVQLIVHESITNDGVFRKNSLICLIATESNLIRDMFLIVCISLSHS